MQASILPKRAGRKAQKLGASAAYLSGGVFRAALCQVRRCQATFCRARRCRASFGHSRRHRATIGHSRAPKRPFIARQQIACWNIAQNRRGRPGSVWPAGAPSSAPHGNAGMPQPAIVRRSVRHSAQPTFAGIQSLQQKSRNIIPVFVLCNADSVIGCFSSISGYLSGQFTYNAPLNEKTHKRSV